jgi:chromosome segregation protein
VSHRIQEFDARAQHERKRGRELLSSGESARRRVAELEAELGMLESAASQLVVGSEERNDVATRYAAESDALLLQLPKLREDLQRLSNVNLNAEADHAELKARELELRKELEDLGRARELLLESIRELDESCETRFVATFELVRAAFADAYAELFPGGEARMWLSDPTHVNESGVEISVRPPGKKMTSLASLSGGERAMTAAALVFALIRVKPAPFYLLDEIDAALDEMNIERFSAMVRNLAAHTQLLIVTHNKKTMEAAERMYGITMAEAGVSTVVSASLEREPAHV